MPASRAQYWAIKNALTPAEKELIKFYEIEWVLKHTVPTVEEVTAHLRTKRPNIRQTSVNYYLMRQPVVKALDDRGIPWRQHSREELTDQQVAAALTVMNFADERSISDKLDQLGINSSAYYAWLNDPVFKNFVDNLSDQNLVNIRPTAIAEFTKLVNKGDWQAIKYYLDVTGTIQNNEQPQSEQLLRTIVEIIQRHVKDPEIILAIAQDIKLASANRTLEIAAHPPAIEGYTVPEKFEEADLTAAKKLIGFG